MTDSERQAIAEQARQGQAILSIEKRLEKIEETLSALNEFATETRGGQKWLWALLSAAASLGTIGGFVLKWKLGGG